MKPRVYLETTIPSYLTARPSRQLVRAAHQQLTRDWWDRRGEYELFVSQFVLDEAAAGEASAATARLAVLAGIPLVKQSPTAPVLVAALMSGARLPPKATTDAFHIAVAAFAGVDYLLTWNCRHIANLTLRPQMEAVCRTAGLNLPQLCTPIELLALEFTNG